MRITRLALATVVGGLCAPATSSANNDLNTSFRANSIALPSPDDNGSSDASVGANQGRPSYQVRIAAPPGRAGLEPGLALAYGGGRQDGIAGAGWGLTVPVLSVKTSGRGGQPRFGTAVTYQGFTGEDLVEAGTLTDVDGDGVDETIFREERDQAIRYVELSAGGWRADYPDGRKLTLGSDADNRIVRSGAGYEAWIAAWLPESLEDPVGNQLVYEWVTAQDLDAAALSPTARYLASIRYGCQACASATAYQLVELEYALRSSIGADPVLDLGPGFLIETEHYLTSIVSSSVGGLTPGEARTYTLGYDPSKTRLLLTSVVERAGAASLPARTFAYSDGDAPATVPALLTSVPAVTFKSGVQPMDLDKDGRVDVIDLSSLITPRWYANNAAAGAGFAASATIASPPGRAPTAVGVSTEDANRDLGMDVFDVSGGRLYAHDGAGGWDSAGTAATMPGLAVSGDTVRLDVDLDGHVDLIDTSGAAATSAWTIYLNDGSGDYTGEVVTCRTPAGVNTPTPKIASVLNASDSGVLFGEVNGDGLVDVMSLDSAGNAYVFYGRGRECWGLFAEDGHGATTYALTAVSGTAPAPGLARLADVSGDGLADLVEIDDPANQVDVWLRTAGPGWSDSGLAGPWTQTISTTSGCRLADFDHDGVAELLCSSGWKKYDFADGQAQLLSSINNGRGLVVSLSYTTTARAAAADAAAGSPWATNVAAAVPVLAAIAEDDSRGHILVRAFDYRDAFYVSDELEDRFEFVGFGMVDEAITPQIKSGAKRGSDPADAGRLVRRFHDVGDTDWYLRGALVCEETWPGGAVPGSTSCGGATGALVRVEHEVSATLDATYGFVRVSTDADNQHVFEGAAAGEHLRNERTYDDYGNVTLELAWGRYDAADPAHGADERATATDYVLDTSSWNLRLPKRMRAGGIDSSGVSPAVDELSKTWLFYDGGTSWNVSSVSDGLLTMTKLWSHDPVAGTSATIVGEERTYTATGLVDQITDAEGWVTDHDYDAALGLLRTREEVDPAGLGLAVTYVVDSRHGGPTSLVGPDGRITRAGYDGFGRMTSVARPGDSLAAPTVSRTYADAAPLSTWTDATKDGTANGMVTTATFDGRGQLVCGTRERAAAQVGVTRHLDRTASGLVALELRTYAAASCGPISLSVTAGAGARATTRSHDASVYDALGRLRSLAHSDGTARAWSYAPLEVTESDEEDHDDASVHTATPRVRSSDGLGRVGSISESHLYADDDPGSHEFAYGYDPLGNLIEVVDSNGATVYTAEYDSRSRPVRIIDADRGQVDTAYDELGHTTLITDARGETVAMTWDAAGRIATTTTAEGRSTYHYDIHYTPVSSTACNTAGRLAWVDDAAGRQVLCYDNAGNLKSAKRYIDSYGATALTTSKTWDTMGRVRTLTHPDGTILTYAFALDGRVKSIVAKSGVTNQTLVSNVVHNAAGQVTGLTYGNGVTLSMSYDDRGRMATSVVTGSAGALQNLSFAYDGVGNLTSVTDAVGFASMEADYDDLYRLAEVSGDRFGGETATYRYDRTGNLVSKTFTDTASPVHVGALTYGHASKPHAVTAVGTETFTYDDAGNLEADGSLSYDYTGTGKLAQVSELSGGALVASFEYDYADRRLAKETGAGDTVRYVREADAELRTVAGTASWVKHVTVGMLPVARIEGSFTAATVSSQVVYLAGDQMYSPTLVLDTTGAVAERAYGHPWGEENTAPLDAAGTIGDYLAPDDPATKLSRRFQGREIDSETGFYDFGARVYRPDLGRFLSPDDVVPDAADGQDWNRYAFVRNNPLRYLDPTGHEPVTLAACWVVAETSWTVYSIYTGVTTMAVEGVTFWGVVGVGVDVGSLVIPGVPGGASMVVKYGDDVGEVALRFGDDAMALVSKQADSVKTIVPASKRPIAEVATSQNQASAVLGKAWEDASAKQLNAALPANQTTIPQVPYPTASGKTRIMDQVTVEFPTGYGDDVVGRITGNFDNKLGASAAPMKQQLAGDESVQLLTGQPTQYSHVDWIDE